MPSQFISSNFPSIPNDLPSVPDNLPTFPGDLPTFPGDLPPVPGDLPPVPGDLPQMPSDPPPQTSINNPTNDYLNTIQTIQQQLPSILDDFKKYYVFYNKNPTYDEYQSIFDNLKSNISTFENELIKITGNTDTNIIQITKQLLDLNKFIQFEKERNINLKSTVSNYNNQYNGSKELITNYKEIYNWNYLMNIFLGIGIITATILLLKIFTPKNNISLINNIPKK